VLERRGVAGAVAGCGLSRPRFAATALSSVLRRTESGPDMPTHERPRFLDLRRVAYPPGAIASIVHRITGVLLAIAVPFAVYAFTRSIAGPDGFAEVAAWREALAVRLALAALVAAFAYHLLAGVRHLLLDAGVAASLRAGRRGAWLVLAAGAAALAAAVAVLLP